MNGVPEIEITITEQGKIAVSNKVGIDVVDVRVVDYSKKAFGRNVLFPVERAEHIPNPEYEPNRTAHIGIARVPKGVHATNDFQEMR